MELAEIADPVGHRWRRRRRASRAGVPADDGPAAAGSPDGVTPIEGQKPSTRAWYSAGAIPPWRKIRVQIRIVSTVALCCGAISRPARQTGQARYSFEPYEAIGMKYRLTFFCEWIWCRKTWLWQFGQTRGATSPRSRASPAPQPKMTTIRGRGYLRISRTGARPSRQVWRPATSVLDSLPIMVVVGLFVVISLAVYEVGFRVGRWWQEREPGEQEGPTGVLVGAILGLMAFLLAVTMGIAADRFDARRGLVLAEANAIHKTYLQADYLPQPATDQMRALLREYLPLRIASSDRAEVLAQVKRSQELHAEMWAIAAEVARSGHSPDLVSSFGESLTELVNLNETRIVSGLYARVPDTILVVLLAGRSSLSGWSATAPA